MADKLLLNTATMLAAMTAIASELGAELTRRHGSMDWLHEMKPRLLTVIKNGSMGDTATVEDEAMFYKVGFAAIELVIAGIKEDAERDGFGGNVEHYPSDPTN